MKGFSNNLNTLTSGLTGINVFAEFLKDAKRIKIGVHFSYFFVF